MSAPPSKNAATSCDAETDTHTVANARPGVRPAQPAPPLDPRLRPLGQALADLLLADLLKYPPKP